MDSIHPVICSRYDLYRIRNLHDETEQNEMKKGTIFIIIGILMVVTATGFFVQNILESNRAGEMSEMVVRELATRISEHD